MDHDDLPVNPTNAAPFADLLQCRIDRRRVLQRSALAAGVALAGRALAGDLPLLPPPGFAELEHGLDEQLHVAANHRAQVLIRWGDPLFADAPAFDPLQQTPEAQARQFGFNNDYTGFLPLPIGSETSSRGLLVVNHEYTLPELMFPGSPDVDSVTEQQAQIELMAHGMSVVEIERDAQGSWSVVTDSLYNRRITPHTPMTLAGPAAGSPRLHTRLSPDGIATYGTYGNCAGGITPWGTVLTGEENIQDYFAGDYAHADPLTVENYRRFGIGDDATESSWPRFFERFDLGKNPNEALHAGWIVEIDPYDPESIPRKRTALGRCKHEGCNVHINPDGRVVAYTGDDQVFEYLYKFVSRGHYNPDDRAANLDLLDDGTLYVARFDESGLDWLPLVQGRGPLTAENGFHSQADVCLDTRKAADLLGATPMDRPEDVEVNPVTGTVFVALTKNAERSDAQRDAANPRATNRGGHILELVAPAGDHAADRFGWELFLLAGDPDAVATYYHPDTTANGWFACPDNLAFDPAGNLWIATDGSDDFGIADGVWVVPVAGPERGKPKHFLRTPRGAELCGPSFTPDGTAFFCAVQHPGDDGGTFDRPTTRWPDFHADLPPRPAVVAVRQLRGTPLGY